MGGWYAPTGPEQLTRMEAVRAATGLVPLVAIMFPMIFMQYSISSGNPPFDIMHYRHFAYVHIFLHLFRHSFSSSHSCIVHVHPLYVVISFWRRPVVSGSMVHMAISTLHLKHFAFDVRSSSGDWIRTSRDML